MPLVIQKYGGTARGPGGFRAIAERIAHPHLSGTQVVVTVSAIGHGTEELPALAARLISRGTEREMDLLLAAGEQKSAARVCLAPRSLDVAAEGLSGSLAGIVTDATPTNASILAARPRRIREILANGGVLVVCSAQGTTRDGQITFLGEERATRPQSLPLPHSTPMPARGTPTSTASSPPIRRSSVTHACSRTSATGR
jgi:aspartate kinase